MKINVIFFALFFVPLYLYAQPDSSRVFIRFNGGYTDYSSSNGASSLAAVSSNNTTWESCLTIGFSVARNWEVGLGIEFQKQKTEAISSMFVSTPRKWASQQITETHIHLLMGKIYAAKYWRLFSRLYFNPDISFGIGKWQGTQKDITLYAEEAPVDEIVVGPPSLTTGGKSDISYDYLALSLTPAFTFFFNRHIAINLATGCFQFSTTNWVWDNRQWLANVNPAYWKLGVIVSF